MKKQLWTGVLTTIITFTMGITSFAAGWQKSDSGWWYATNDTGSTWHANGWQWIDGNGDGTAECYYFDGNGYCLMDTITPDGCTVNAEGAWVENGIVQTKPSQQSGQNQQSSGKYNENGISNTALDLLNHSREENALKYEENSKKNIAGSKYYNKTSFKVDYNEDGTANKVWFWAYLDGSIWAEKFDASVKDMFIDAPDEVKSFSSIVEDLQGKGYQCRGYYGHIYVEFGDYELEFWAISDDTYNMELERLN